MNQVTCNRCGWVHFGLSREAVETEVRTFNEFYDAAPAHVRENYSQRASVEDYKKCFKCGGSWMNMRETKVGECPVGSTIQPILVEDV